MEIKPFKFWCQKILPLSYDDSLSYYEVLCKTADKINELINSINNLSIDVLDEKIKPILDELRKQIASANDGESTTSLSDKTVGELVWINNMLYKVIRPIQNGDRYVFSNEENPNVNNVTIEELIDTCNEMLAEINSKITNIKIYNVLDYGAKGDGVTDDTIAITNLLTNHPNDTIYFPKGNYLVTNMVISNKRIIINKGEITGNVYLDNFTGKFCGGTIYGTLILQSCTNTSVNNVDVHPNSGLGIYLKNSNDCNVDGCYVEKISGTSTGDILVDECTNCSITRCYCFSDTINHNIQAKDSHKIRINSCYVKNAKEFGISLWRTDYCIVSNNNVYNTIKEAINVQDANANIIANNVVEWDLNVSTDFGISVYGSEGFVANNNVIEGNYITNCAKCGVALAGIASSNQVSNNHIFNCNSSVTNENMAMFIYTINEDDINTFNIMSNNFINPGTYTDKIFVESGVANHNRFENNLIWGSNRSYTITGTKSSVKGIGLDYTSATNISFYDDNGVIPLIENRSYYELDGDEVKLHIFVGFGEHTASGHTRLTVPYGCRNMLYCNGYIPQTNEMFFGYESLTEIILSKNNNQGVYTNGYYLIGTVTYKRALQVE